MLLLSEAPASLWALGARSPGSAPADVVSMTLVSNFWLDHKMSYYRGVFLPPRIGRSWKSCSQLDAS